MKKWVVSVMKTKPWESTLSMIRTITGSKLSPKDDVWRSPEGDNP
jgi:hypothetical protein